MISFTFKGHKISIRNDDWRKLKERFDPKNVVKDGKAYLIPSKCPLCIRYMGKFKCPKCPVNIISPSHCGGVSIINSFFKSRYFVYLRKGIWWINNTNARHQLEAILRRMEKIEANQKEEL